MWNEDIQSGDVNFFPSGHIHVTFPPCDPSLISLAQHTFEAATAGIRTGAADHDHKASRWIDRRRLVVLVAASCCLGVSLGGRALRDHARISYQRRRVASSRRRPPPLDRVRFPLFLRQVEGRHVVQRLSELQHPYDGLPFASGFVIDLLAPIYRIAAFALAGEAHQFTISRAC